MKINDLDNVIIRLKDVKDFANKNLDYNTSTYINQQLISALPVLEAEYERLDNGKIDINCPAMEIINSEIAEKEGLTAIDMLNRRMQELVENEYKIIDFGLYDKIDSPLGINPPVYYLYIKYTS